MNEMEEVNGGVVPLIVAGAAGAYAVYRGAKLG